MGTSKKRAKTSPGEEPSFTKLLFNTEIEDLIPLPFSQLKTIPNRFVPSQNDMQDYNQAAQFLSRQQPPAFMPEQDHEGDQEEDDQPSEPEHLLEGQVQQSLDEQPPQNQSDQQQQRAVRQTTQPQLVRPLGPASSSDLIPLSGSPGNSSAKDNSKSRWTSEDISKLTNLKREGRKWTDISRLLDNGKSANACRKMYHSVLSKDGQWTTELDQSFRNAYQRTRENIWSSISRELGIPWDRVERRFCELGLTDILRRPDNEE